MARGHSLGMVQQASDFNILFYLLNDSDAKISVCLNILVFIIG
jgi:hypothetical protein